MCVSGGGGGGGQNVGIHLNWIILYFRSDGQKQTTLPFAVFLFGKRSFMP